MCMCMCMCMFMFMCVYVCVYDEVTCKEREQCKTIVVVGLELVQSDVPKVVQDTSYGPWVVVARKKNGTRAHSTGGAPVGQQIAQELKGNGKYEVDG